MGGRRSTSRVRRRPPPGSAQPFEREITIAEKEEKIELEGEVVESFRSGMHKVALDNGHDALAYTAGKMKRYRIRIAPGDRVTVQLSPYDLTRGRIVFRQR